MHAIAEGVLPTAASEMLWIQSGGSAQLAQSGYYRAMFELGAKSSEGRSARQLKSVCR